MIPILPFLAWTGGIAAGAQVVGGFVRGAGQLARGYPGRALVEVADGLASPVRMAIEQVGKLGGDVLDAVVGYSVPELPLPPDLQPSPRRRRRRDRSAPSKMPSLNGLPAAIQPDS
jgi:hypothetical protein